MASSITFWMKAFIPYHVDGVTKTIPNNPKESMIIGPRELNTTKSNWDLVKDAVIPGHALYDATKCYGYKTDQRDFSASYSAKARMNCAFNLILRGENLKNAELDAASRYNYCDTTYGLDADTGAVLKTGNAPNSNMSFTQGLVSEDQFNVDMSMAAADPVVLGAAQLANINFSGTITIHQEVDRRRGRYNWALSVDILLDNFPAFEAYAAINQRGAFPIFQRMPAKGYTVMDLIDIPAPNTKYGAGIYRNRSRVEKHSILDSDGDNTFDTLR